MVHSVVTISSYMSQSPGRTPSCAVSEDYRKNTACK